MSHGLQGFLALGGIVLAALAFVGALVRGFQTGEMRTGLWKSPHRKRAPLQFWFAATLNVTMLGLLLCFVASNAERVLGVHRDTLL